MFLGSLRGYTHLPENPFMVDAGFQVPFDGWTHRRLSQGLTGAEDSEVADWLCAGIQESGIFLPFQPQRSS